MPITIKELFPSDPLSAALEKINFNFDQLILAGGGPPGPAGPIGPQGVPGPLGTRGDHWFVGASALGQTADHDGGALKIEDHFLDILGDVYSYFEVSGSTGWTASGINLMGPMGPTGPVGGSDDVLIQAGGSGNAVTPLSGGFGPQASTTPTSLNDFWFPKNMGKNSIFVGDVNWAINKLQNFGSNASAGIDLESIPQFTLIQKNVNQSGLNGLMIGAYGAASGATTNALAEGGTGSTTSVFDFVHFGFAKPLNSAGFDRMFRIKTFRQKFRIEVGGPVSGGSFDQLRNLELASNNFSWVNNTNGQFLSNLTRQSITTHDLVSYSGGVIGSGIEFNTKPKWSGGYANHNYGIIGLQTQQGLASGSGEGLNPLHGFGNVHIGSTANLIGVRQQQGLGIQRPIEFGSGNNDASIRFFGGDLLESGNDWSAIGGGIRMFKQSVTNTSGTIPIRALQIGAGYPITATLTPSTMSRQIGGRVGINNHPGWNDFGAARRINFPVHINLTGFQQGDKATSPYPGQPLLWSIEQWAFGIDYDTATGETGSWHAGWDTDSAGLGVAYGYGYTAPYGGSTYTTRPIILNTYYNGGATFNTYTGRRNPNLYLQLGRDTGSGATGDGSYGNIGIGFSPTPFDSTSTIDAWSKLSVNGGITVGDVFNGYHVNGAYRPYMGLSIQGAITQGATSLNNIFSTSMFGGTATSNAYVNNYTISGNGLIAGRNFLSRGFAGITFSPDFALPDLKTGIMYDPTAGHEYTGWLTSPRALPPTVGGSVNPDTTTTPKKVAKWANRGENGYNNNNDYSSFTVEETFSTRPVTVTTNGLQQKYINNVYPGGSVQCSIWEIPVKSSMIFLDLSERRGGMLTLASGGGGIWQGVAGMNEFYLNGAGTSSSIITRSVGFSLEDGHYDGQTLTLTVLDVEPNNNGTLLPNRPYFSGSTVPVSIAPAYQSLDDNIVMAAEPFSAAGIGTNPAFAQNTMPLTVDRININGANEPYPTPFGPFNNKTTPNSLGLGTVTQIANAIVRNTQTWTNRAILGNNPPSSNGNGGFNGNGYGAFYIIPYRTIRFVWRFNSSSGIAGKWYETGRENLVRPLTRTWDPGEYLDTAVAADPGSGDTVLPDPGPTTTCCFLPGTLITMSNGTFKAIEDIKAGDKVISVLDGTQEIVENEVIETVEVLRTELIEVILDNGNKFTTTNDHPIWVEGKGWSAIDKELSATVYKHIEISDLIIGDTLFSLDSKPKIISIKKSEIESSLTYTFATKNVDASNYIAANILAHNKTAPGPNGSQVTCFIDP